MPDLPMPWLSLITDSTVYSNNQLEDKVRQAVAAGVDSVHLRDKRLGPHQLLPISQTIRKITRNRCLFIIHDSIDLTITSQADGIQLSEKGMPISEARARLGTNFLIGKSVHSLPTAVSAENSGADYVIVGTIFPSKTHPDIIPVGPELLINIAQHLSIPQLGIGGITTDNVASVIRSGSRGAAVISSILGSHNPFEATLRLRARMEEAWIAQPKLG